MRDSTVSFGGALSVGMAKPIAMMWRLGLHTLAYVHIWLLVVSLLQKLVYGGLVVRFSNYDRTTVFVPILAGPFLEKPRKVCFDFEVLYHKFC